MHKGFIGSMEYSVCICAASLVEKEISKETKWRRARDCVHRSLAKVLFAIEGNKLWSHREFCVSGGFLGERRACLH